MNAENINKKFKVRKILKDVVEKSFNQAETSIENKEENIQERIQSIVEVIKKKIAAIKTLENEIIDLELNTEHIEQIINEGTEFEIFCKTKLNILNKFLSTTSTTKEKANTKRGSNVINLPKFEITKFNGDSTHWQSFFDSFNAAVDQSTSLTNIEKFNYLRCYLEGDALQAIAGFSLTNDNYEEALQLLKNRYGNTQQIISAHMNTLVKLKPVINKDLNELRKFYDQVNSHVRSLVNLGVESSTYGSLLCPVILEKLPSDIRLIISRNRTDALWDFTRMLELINDELKARESCILPDQQSGANDSSTEYTGSALLSAGADRNPKGRYQYSRKCIFCKGDHWSDKCNVITDPQARKEYLKNNKLCFRCLKKDHTSRNCKKEKTCFYCQGLHNSAICTERNKGNANQNTATEAGNETSTNFVSNLSSVLLQTADLLVENTSGTKQAKLKVLFDQGSQRTYVTKRIKNLLSLNEITKEKISINTFGDSKTKGACLDKVNLILRSHENETFAITALCTDYICLPVKNQPVVSAQSSFDHLKGLKLADSGHEGEIDILVGSDWYWELVTGKVKVGNSGEPVGVESKFGWLLNGPISYHQGGLSRVNVASCTSAHTMLRIDCSNERNFELNEHNVTQFWDLETIGIKENESSPYDNFKNSIRVNFENRYETCLPFKENHDLLNDNYNLCEKRLLNLHKKLKQNPDLLKRYDDTFREQKDLGIIEEAANSTSVGKCHYLPHHGVFREDHETTKMRIVFDASSKSDGPSLNDCLYKGPQLTPLIYDILLRFRTFLFALTADIQSAFLQISINETDRDYLRFLWFNDVFADKPTIIRNRFARVVFGVTSSPFLLNAVIHKHVEKFEFDTDFIQKVLESFYVDDFSGGANTIEETFELFKKLKLRFLEGMFNLRKWRTNDINLRKQIGIETNKTLKPTKILGILWDEQSDLFIFEFEEILKLATSLEPTKRNVLKVLSMFFDPLGMLQAIIVNFKIIFQNICKLKLQWDEPLPPEILKDWEEILNALSVIESITFPRKMIDQSKPIESIELFGFSDSSFQAYGACIYLRTVYKSNEVQIHLVTAKSRVAPLKEMTIPRLELLGNLILARLMFAVQNALKTVINISRKFYYTDSKVTLSWIKSVDKEFQTFVENRLKEIRKLSNYKDWNFIETSLNPADVLTRKQSFLNFKENTLYWEGPAFLKENPLIYVNKFDEFKIEQSELEVKTLLFQSKANIDIISIENYNSLQKLYRITAWVFRYFSNLKRKVKGEELQLSPFITAAEINSSETYWIKQNQTTIDSKKLDCLWKQLSITRDENELLRCVGRLSNAPLPYNTRQPYLINRQHHLAKLIVWDIHERFKHISVKQVLTELRQKYWICSARGFIRNLLYKCTVCRKYQGQSYSYPESPALTTLRLQDAYPFFTTGIDNFGPLFVKNVFKGNSHELYKVWVTLYTCAATRGIVLDMVPFIDSKSFIESLRRFISRRGCPSHIISDCGRNFVSSQTQSFVNSMGITWHTNLPLSPWHGGFFERLVKSTKELLRKDLKTYKLTYNELQTVLYEIEAILNNRPITYYYEDESECCLTPSHLLFGRTLQLYNPAVMPLSYPNPNLSLQPSKLNNILMHFWDRWRHEYLTNLRESHKSCVRNGNKPMIKKDDIVVIEEPNLPRSTWKLARVHEIIISKDGNIRGALLKVAKTNAFVKRPVNKLYLVESHLETVNKKDIVQNQRPKREAAILGELKRKYSP